MNTPALRELIRLARHQEAASHELARQMEIQLPRLHPAIRLRSGDAMQVLADFVTAYIERVPDLLDAADAVAHAAGIERQIASLLKVAEQFFLSPPPLHSGHRGLAGLLDEAYLAHRLVEEVNDRYLGVLGQPLIPLDTTTANLIAHQLIGEPFANELDEIVQQIAESVLDDALLDRDSLQTYRERLASPHTVAAWRRWPCLSRQLGVELQLAEGQSVAG